MRPPEQAWTFRLVRRFTSVHVSLRLLCFNQSYTQFRQYTTVNIIIVIIILLEFVKLLTVESVNAPNFQALQPSSSVFLWLDRKLRGLSDMGLLDHVVVLG